MRLTTEIAVPAEFPLDATAQQKAVALMERAECCILVTTKPEADTAIDAARDIRSWLKEVEAARVELTKPLLTAQRKLKELADNHCDPLLTEQKRLERLYTDFVKKEERRVAEAERQRQAEIARLEAERLAREAQAVRAATDIADEAQLNQAIKLEQEAKAAEVKLQEAIVAPLPEVRKSGGAATKKVLRYEVLDIAQVYAARPELCKLEIKASAVLATCVPEMPVPGLKLWWEKTTNVRSK